MTYTLKNKRVLVTGACGTIGKELVRQLLEFQQVEELVAIDNNESEIFFLEQNYANKPGSQFFIADVRDRDKISRLMHGIDIVFHTAAYKHVILCERSPYEAVQTNILAVQNLIIAAFENKVERVIFTSSDKAVNPTNVMGTSKLMGERLISAANSTWRGQGPIFASTRFGNVMGSRGSVIPIFHQQIRNGRPVTLTHPEMTRFIMSIQEAVRLVVDSVMLACGGEVFVTKMKVIRIKDLAEVMIENLAPKFNYNPENIEIRIIGAKPGEKMYEELMNHEETRRSLELKKYFVVIPAFGNVNGRIKYSYNDIMSMKISAAYHSGNEKQLTKKALLQFFKDNKLFEY